MIYVHIVERISASCLGHDWMAKVKGDGRVEVPTRVVELARRDFVAERVSDEEVSRLLII